MNYLTHQLLNPQEINILKKNLNLRDLSWEDGKKTAGNHAAKVKENLQLDRSSNISKKCAELIEKKYLSNNNKLEKNDKKKFDELIRRFYLNKWRIILLMCNYQTKYRYYSKVMISIKDKSFPEMKNKDFLKLFENN